MRQTLYADRELSSFFHIPDDEALPSGELVLESLCGRRIEVDPSAALPFEVDRESALEITRRVMADVSRRAGRFMVACAWESGPEPEAPPGAGLDPELHARLESLGRLARDAVGPALEEALRALPEVLREKMDDPKTWEEVREAAHRALARRREARAREE